MSSELVSVTQQEFTDHMNSLSQQHRWIGRRLTDFINGAHGVQYPLADGTVVGEVIHNREFGTTWFIRKDGANEPNVVHPIDTPLNHPQD